MRLTTIALFILTVGLAGCGGGSSDSGILIEGTLTEAGGAGHSASRVRSKHSDGQRIENVRVCALGECSVTDGQGQWGFVVDKGFSGGGVAFSFSGHGIDTTTTVFIPSGADEVMIDFRHVEGGRVEAHHINVGDEEAHSHNDSHTSE